MRFRFTCTEQFQLSGALGGLQYSNLYIIILFSFRQTCHIEQRAVKEQEDSLRETSLTEGGTNNVYNCNVE